MQFNCARCGKVTDRPAGHVNRSRASGMKLYCGRRCFGLDRRLYKSKAQKRAEKKAYDARRRVLLAAEIKAAKAAYHKLTYDPAKARIVRKRRARAHAEYCRRPEYKRWKQGYDRQHRAKKQYGPFAEAAMVTIDLNRAIKERMTNHEIKWQNQTANKTQFRRRADKEKDRSRPRHRDRRDRHQAAVG